ncbi:Sporulation-specific cell division protein SsgB (plasmid) [Streptomyces sp. enrichment culture]
MGLPDLELHVRMTLAAIPEMHLPVRFYYLRTDPYAVQVFFDVTPDQVVHWAFARELLDQGMEAATGLGDVRIAPTGPLEDRRISIELETPDGYARLEGPAAPIKAWLARTHESVPAGSEAELLHIDRLLDEFLAR